MSKVMAMVAALFYLSGCIEISEVSGETVESALDNLIGRCTVRDLLATNGAEYQALRLVIFEQNLKGNEMSFDEFRKDLYEYRFSGLRISINRSDEGVDSAKSTFSDLGLMVVETEQVFTDDWGPTRVFETWLIRDSFNRQYVFTSKCDRRDVEIIRELVLNY